jgi:hypothetical protein
MAVVTSLETPVMTIETLSPGGTTFRVADVRPAGAPRRQVPYKEAIESLLEPERWCKGEAYRPIEAWTRPSGHLLADVHHHPLVTAVAWAYAEHRPLSLSPDMIWLLICQGVAHHINANAEELRGHFVRHQGKLTLTVRRDDFNKGSPDNPWPQVFHEFSARIREHIGATHDLFVASFSTTGPVEKAVSEIVLLEAMKRYFHYLLMTVICGIPAIRLEGTPADWDSIADRAEAFAPADMEWWLSRLRPILRQFRAAARGDVDRAFWQSIYRVYQPDEPCSASSAMGWINLFFPYLVDGQGLPTQQNPWLSGERDLDELLAPTPEKPRTAGAHRTDDYLTWREPRDPGYIHDGEYPSGLAKAPFTWEERDRQGNLRNRWDMEFLGGFVGVAQDSQSLCLRPEIGWVVREASAEETLRSLDD